MSSSSLLWPSAGLAVRSSSDTGTSDYQHQSQPFPDDSDTGYRYSASGTASFLDALDFLNTDNPVTDTEEEAFRRKLQRKKKKRRGPKI